MDILYPKDKRLELFEGIRPLTAPDPQQIKRTCSAKSAGKSQTDRPETAPQQHTWNARKPRNLMPIVLDREVCKARRVLQRAESEDFSKVNKIGSPGGHIARIEANKRGEALKVKFGTKMFCFSENIDDLMSYNTKDTAHERPAWSQNFVKHHVERAEREVDKRKKKRAKEKALSTCQNAISVTMHDIVAMYTSPFSMPQGKGFCPSHPTPIHLNDDEIHVWQKLRVSLYSCGQFFSHKSIDHIAAKQKHSNEPMHPVLAHFLRYLNILLGGSSSLRAARHILLKDVSYLLKLLQEIDVLKLPLDSLRDATAFRMRELLFLGEQLKQQRLSDNTSTSSTVQSDVITSSSCEPRSTIFSATDELTDERKRAAAEMNLYDRLRSWMFSLSLLAKIALVSAERTPLKKLLKQKDKNPNGAVTVLCRNVSTHFGSSAHSLFRQEVGTTVGERDVDEEVEVEEIVAQNRSNRRRVSLSMILGVCPGFTGTAEKYSTKVLSDEDEKSELTEDEIIALRHEFFGTHTTATNFHSIKRLSMSSYGDLEKLLQPFYRDTAVEVDTSYPMLSMPDNIADMHQDVPFASDNDLSTRSSNGVIGSRPGVSTVSDNEDSDCVQTEETTTMPTDADPLSYLEMGGGEAKFRMSSKGVLFMSDAQGKFKKCTKDMSLYYDMLTEDETMSSMLHSYHHHGCHQDITAIDLFRSTAKGADGDTPGKTLDEFRLKEKQRRLEENSQFVDVLVRATHLHMREAPRSDQGKFRLGESLHGDNNY